MKLMKFLLAMGTLALAGCTSTDVLDEPSASVQDDMTISIGLSAPEAYNFPMTRVSNDVQLRYVAKLYKDPSGKGNIDVSNFVERKEVLAKDGNKVIFKAQPGNYVVAVFADYVDADAQATGDCYPDKYYDTSSAEDRVVMLAIKPESGSKKTVYSNINTENFDCFATKHTVKKEAQVYEANVTLPRVVSKVRVVSKDGNVDGVESIQFSKFSFLYIYSFNQKCSLHAQTEIPSAQLASIPGTITMSDPSKGELFYFYTFGGDGSTGFDEIAFKINPKQDYEYPSVTIPSGKVKTKPNYIYTLSGSLLTPTKEPNDEIRLTLSEQDEWGSNTDINL